MSSKKILTFLIVFILFGLFSFSYALEVTYPPLGNYTLSSSSTLPDFVGYFINLALIFGIIAAVTVLVYAGINVFFSAEDPTKVGESKKKIINAFLGLLVLFGFYMIINYINPNILGIRDVKVEQGGASTATDGICLTYTDSNNKAGTLCTESSLNNISYTITGIEWKSSAEDLPSIYVYESANFEGTPQVVNNGGSLSGSPKSIYLNWKKEGVFLYDDLNFGLKKQSMPVSFQGKTNVLPQGFANNVSSIKIINPSSGYKYAAILFPNASYRGDSCSWIMSDAADLSKAISEQENNPALGNNKLSSLLVLKANSSAAASVTFYNRLNCQSDPTDENDAKDNICVVSGSFVNRNIFGKDGACPDFKGTVVSFTIDDATGVLFKTGLKDAADVQCQYFSKQANATCINTEKYSDVYNQDLDPAVSPQSFTLFSLYTGN